MKNLASLDQKSKKLYVLPLESAYTICFKDNEGKIWQFDTYKKEYRQQFPNLEPAPFSIRCSPFVFNMSGWNYEPYWWLDMKLFGPKYTMLPYFNKIIGSLHQRILDNQFKFTMEFKAQIQQLDKSMQSYQMMLLGII